VVRNLLIEGTELAGVFFWATTPQFAPTTGSRHVGTVEASRFSDIGVHPIIFEWGFFGKDNFGNVTIRGNFIDESNRFGVSLILNSQLDSLAQGNGALIDMRNNRVNSDLAILVNLAGAGASGNCLAASIDGNVIVGSETSLNVLIADAGSENRVEFEFSDNSYSLERPPLTPGPQRTAVNVTDDPDNDFRFSGSFGGLQSSNRMFDFRNVDLKTDFTNQPFDPQKCS
jgi:hypothetical protein